MPRANRLVYYSGVFQLQSVDFGDAGSCKKTGKEVNRHELEFKMRVCADRTLAMLDDIADSQLLWRASYRNHRPVQNGRINQRTG